MAAGGASPSPRLALAAPAAAAAAVVAASLLLDLPLLARLPVLCPSRVLAGIPCPGCGLTRSLVAAAHGELGRAFEFHLFGPLVLCACAAAALWLPLRGLAARPPLSAAVAARARAALVPLLAGWLAWSGWRAVSAL